MEHLPHDSHCVKVFSCANSYALALISQHHLRAFSLTSFLASVGNVLPSSYPAYIQNLILPLLLFSCSVLSYSVWPQVSLSFTISQSLPKLMSIESVMPSNHLVLCHPLLLLPSIFPSIRIFSNELAFHIRWSKYWSFSISPSNEYSGLMSFRIDWFDLLAVQGTLKSLLQHHSSKSSILQCSAFSVVQLSHPYMTTGKSISLTRRTFVSKVMSLLLNMLSRSVIALLQRSKCLLISWLQSQSAVIL